ncbi:MAG: mercuric reductase [Chloroflexi bacterium]|nr:MAG: mercuric reductase [Chloroflexota bacterium]
MVTESRTYDAVIVGAGQSGVPLSTALSRAGWKVALVERHFVGGSCINWGCTPTKTMVASARVAHVARRAGGYGVQAGPVAVDLAAVRRRKEEIVEGFRQGLLRRIQEAEGVDLLRGEAQFTGHKALAVRLNDGGSLHLSADKIFINTGGRPHVPGLPGLEEVPFLDSTSIMELEDLPEHLIVIGGGYVGLEFGQMFCRFGSQVSIVQRDGQLLSHEDRDVAEAVAEILREDGIQLFLGAEAQEVRLEDGAVNLHVQTPHGQQVVRGTHLLVATGRDPNTDALSLAAGGVAVDRRGNIVVDERLETNVPGVYAIGDVKGGPAFTHVSYDDYRILCANLLNGGDRTVHDRPVPYVVFTDPQLGRVGLTEKQAREAGHRFRVASMPMSWVARAVEVDEMRGFMKALVDAESDQILGVAVLGYQGGEIMAMLQVAMMGRLPYTTLRDAVFTHPTLAESLNTLFSTLEDIAD